MIKPIFPALLLSLLVLLSACQKPEDREPRWVGHALKYNLNAPVAEGQETHLEFWTQVDYEAIYREVADDYMRVHPQVTINVVAFDFNDYFNTIGLALQSGIGPDLFHMHNAFHTLLSPHAAPYPEEVMPLGALMQDFRQVLPHLENNRVRYIDTLLMTSSIFYNKDQWQEAGLEAQDIPLTWDQLREVARKLTVNDDAGNLVRSGFNPNGIGYSIFTAMNLQQGQSPLPPSRGPIIDTPEARKSMEFLRGLYAGDPVCDIRFDEFHESFGAGQSSMIYAWGWVSNWLTRTYPDLSWGSFPTPTWDGESQQVFDRNNGESSPCVNASADPQNQEVAFDFIKFYLAHDDYLLHLAQRFAAAPAKRSLDQVWARYLLEQGKAAPPDLDRTVWPGVITDVWETALVDTLIDPVIIDGEDVGQALKFSEVRLRELSVRQEPSR